MSAEQLAALIDEHSAALTLLARSLCDCPEDVVQEAFIKLSQQMPWPDQPRAWLCRVVRNQAFNARRATRRRTQHEDSAAAVAQPWFRSNAEELVDAELATNALQQLPEDQREVVVLRIWSRMTFQEIGRLTETSDSTAQRKYAAALEALRQRLEPTCPKSTKK